MTQVRDRDYFNGLQQHNFSLLGFYASRARRIIPALLALCVVLLMFGFVYLPLDDYREFIRSIKSSLLFSSNFMFAKEGDYFSAPLHENWLLHTWPLSVEWQFYMVYPLVLMALHRFMGAHKTKAARVLLALNSLGASVYLPPTQPVFAFLYIAYPRLGTDGGRAAIPVSPAIWQANRLRR